MSADHYTTLGVSPSAESVVIRAAYRALIRHYHPDSNPDPEAHERARAITEAYNVLRDPAKRAEYDAGARASKGDDWWSFDAAPRPSMRPPAMRAGIGAAALAIVAVAVVWAWPGRERFELPPESASTESSQPKASVPSKPIVELEPESQRLADLVGIAKNVPPELPSLELPATTVLTEPRPDLAAPMTSILPAPPPARMPKPAPVVAQHVPTAPVPAPKLAATAKPPAPAAKMVATAKPPAEKPKMVATAKPPAEKIKQVAAAPKPPAPNGDRLATLERISAGFYNQSMQNADAAKKQLLLSVRMRQTSKRGACRSDSCVADSYMRQIREIREIMEKPSGS